jgi:hypothetical protein
MDQELSITYLNNNEKIIHYNSESKNRFNQRLSFIKILENNNITWKEANKLSKIWYNIKFNKCKYQPELYKKFIHYDKLLDASKIT